MEIEPETLSASDIRRLFQAPSTELGSDKIRVLTLNSPEHPKAVVVEEQQYQLIYAEGLRAVIENTDRDIAMVIYDDQDGQRNYAVFWDNNITVEVEPAAMTPKYLRRLMKRPCVDRGTEVRAFMNRPTVEDQEFCVLFSAIPPELITVSAERNGNKFLFYNVYEAALSRLQGRAWRIRFTDALRNHSERFLRSKDYERIIFYHENPNPFDPQP